MPKLHNLAYGYIYNADGTYKDKLIFEATTKNIASFIWTNNSNACTITDLGDNLIVSSTEGGFVDVCPNQRYLQTKLLPVLIPMQIGESEPVDIEFIQDDYFYDPVMH